MKRILHEEKGAVAALVLLFLPLLLLVVGAVVDVGLLFGARSTAYAAADLGALAGVQELDLTRLAWGERYLLPGPAARQAREVTLQNLEANLPDLLRRGAPEIFVEVIQAGQERPARHPLTGRTLWDPTVVVEVRFQYAPLFLRPLAAYLPVRARADASVLPRR